MANETIITYNNSTIATLGAGQMATLKCKGDNVRMLTDIVVKAGSGGALASYDGKVTITKKVPVFLVPEGTIFEYWSPDGESVLSLSAGEPFPQPLPDDSALIDQTNDGGDVNYKYSADTNSWRVWSCMTPFNAREATIRDSIGGAPVTAIDNGFYGDFFGVVQVELVRIPKSITSIINEAFGYCNKLKDIVYAGTTAEWNNINFSDDWNAGCSAITVTCTDGTIDVPAGPTIGGSE